MTNLNLISLKSFCAMFDAKSTKWEPSIYVGYIVAYRRLSSKNSYRSALYKDIMQ